MCTNNLIKYCIKILPYFRSVSKLKFYCCKKGAEFEGFIGTDLKLFSKCNLTQKNFETLILIKGFLHFVLMRGDDQLSIFAAARGKHKLIHLDDHKKQEPSISQQMNGLLLGWKHNKSGSLMVHSCIRACL